MSIEQLHDYNCNVSTREIFLHRHVNSDYDSDTDYLMAMQFLKNIKFLESINNNLITIHQYNCGGDFSCGCIIFDSIRHSTCPTRIFMHGAALSMGAIIPQAADIRIIMPNCLFMIHEQTIEINGTLKQHASAVQINNKTESLMFDTLVEKIRKGPFFVSNNYTDNQVLEFIRNRMNSRHDWYMTPKEAVYYGFADYVL